MTGDTMSFSTKVRKLHQGKYYLIYVQEHFFDPAGFSEKDHLKNFAHFHYKCYEVLMFYIVDPAIMINGIPLNEPDLIQLPEKLRYFDSIGILFTDKERYKIIEDFEVHRSQAKL